MRFAPLAWLPSLAAVAALCAACDSGDDGDAAPRSVTLAFDAVIGSQSAACGVSYQGMGSADTTVELRDLRYFVSRVRLVTAEGDEVALELEENDWQHADVALLDFEDGTGLCADGGTPDTRTVVTGMVPSGDYTGVVFDLGVPFELNHLDTTTAPSPLNLPSMFWNWQGGHKHARIDFDNGAASDSGWNVHLGSTGCMSEGAAAAPSSPCANPNVATIRLDGFDADTGTIVFDAAALVAGVDLTFNSPMSPPGCMSFPTDEAECLPIFDHLGLSFDTGECVGACDGQQVFSVR